MAAKPTYEELVQRVQELEQADSEHKRIEKELFESGERFRQIYNNIIDVYYETSLDGIILEISPSIETHSKYKREELIGKSIYTIYSDPEDRNNFIEIITNSGSVKNYEINLTDKDGSQHYCSMNIELVKDDRGNPIKLIGIFRDITEQKQAEEALRLEKTFVDAIFNSIPGMLYLYDEEGKLIRWNKNHELMTGYSSEELSNMHLLDWYKGDAESQKAVIAGIEITMERGFGGAEANLHKKDGTIIPFYFTACPLTINGKQYFTGIGIDITERKRAEEALRESQERLLSVFRAAPTGIGVVIDRVLTQVNERICEMTGYSKEELTGQSAKMLYMSDEDYEYVGREKYKQIAARGTGTVETCWKRKDGRIIDVLLSSTPMDIDDLSKGVTFTALDITDRKKTQEVLRVSHERFLTVLDSIDATVYVADMETHEILFMNKNMVEAFGRDMTGETCWAAFRGESEPCRDCNNNQIIDKNGKPAGVFTYQRKNPITGKWYINHDRAIEWTDKGLVRLQVATDITNFKKMEEELRQAHKMEAVGTLTGGIAHDFNNLLMGIQGHASLISMDLESSHPHVEHIKAIEEYIRSAVDLTRQLIGFVRGGKYEVKPVDINELVLTSADMFGRTRKGIRIHSNMKPEELIVEADRGQIEQVFLNIFINAWQAMPDGGEIYLETSIVNMDKETCLPHQIDPGRYVKISVTDTGIGMDNTTRQRIFDPFFTTKEKGRGTGLGLASAYGIVKNHGGMLSVYSEPGHGTTLSIYLPVSDKKAQKVMAQEKEMIQGSETILLVDDEEMIINVGKAMLERLGYRVVTATDGKQAVKVVSKMDNEIDMVILDIIMPGIDGGEAFDRIREIQPELPVMLSSGYTVTGHATEIMSRGCNGFIQKPFNLSELSQKIRQILDETKGSIQS